MTLPVQSPTQIAWVTGDLDATETALTGLLGVRKWVRIPDVHFAADACSYRGKPADFVASISLSYLGDMQLELIQPVRGENIYSDFLSDGGPGLHHICVEADSPEQLAEDAGAGRRAGRPGGAAGCDARRNPLRLCLGAAGRSSVRGVRLHRARDAGVLRLHQTAAAVSRARADARHGDEEEWRQ